MLKISLSNLRSTMLNLKSDKIIFAITLTILTHFALYIEMSGQENRYPTSLFKLCRISDSDKTTSIDIASDNKSNIVIPLLYGKIRSIKPNSGEKNWETDLGGIIVSTSLINDKDNSIIVQSKIYDKLVIRSLNNESGLTNWQSVINNYTEDDKYYLNQTSDALLLISRNAKVILINKDNGTIISERDLKFILTTTPVKYNNQIYFGTLDNKIIGYSIETLEIVSKIQVATSPQLIFLTNNNHLLFGDNKGETYFINLNTQRIEWKIRFGAALSSVIMTDDSLIISSLDNFTALVSIKDKGRFVWRKRFDERFNADPVVIDNYLIITANFSGKATILDTKNGKLIDQISLTEGNYFYGQPKIIGELLVIPTIKGLAIFINAENDCLSK